MHYLFCLIAGVISAFAFVPKSWLVCGFVGYTLLFYCLNTAQSKKKHFALGFLFGFGQGAVSMLWLVNALLIDSGSFAWAIPLVPMGFGLLFGIFFGLSTLPCAWTQNTLSKIVMFAGCLTFFEWVRSWFLTGFPWNLAGSVWLVALPVLQSVAFFGIYGLSLCSILWYAVPFLCYKKQIKSVIVLAISFVFCFVLGYLRIQSTEPQEYEWGVKLRLVQPNIPQTLKWDPSMAEDHFMEHIRMSKSKPEDKITHVLWPEAASPYRLDADEQARSMTMMALNQDQTLITGSLREADVSKKQLANSIFVIDDMANITAYADKAHLVPFGEYMPLRGVFGLEKLVPLAGDIKSGDEVKTLHVPNAPTMGALVCYEVIFPHQVVNRKIRPKWLFNATNDSWYGLSDGPYQHLGAAQTRAVEEGLPVVRVATGGVSAVIAPTGKILSSIPLGQKGVLDAPLPTCMPPTIYGRFGNIVPLFFALACIIFALCYRKKDQKFLFSNG